MYPRTWAPHLADDTPSDIFSVDPEPEPQVPEPAPVEPEELPVQTSRTEPPPQQSTTEVAEIKSAASQTVATAAAQPGSEQPTLDAAETHGISTSSHTEVTGNVEPPAELATEETVETKEHESEPVHHTCPLAIAAENATCHQ